MCMLWNIFCSQASVKNEGNLESVVTNDHNVPRPNRTTTQQQSRPVNRTNRPSTTENSQPTSTEASGSTQQTAHPEATTSSGQETEEQSTTSVKDEEQANDSPLPPKYPKLQDFGSVEELHNLSAKDLKVLLTLNRVDFKGCVEKSELLERAERLWEDTNEQNKEVPENLPVQDLCKLCMDAPLDCVLLECGHIATCTNCGKKLAECPICRQYVVRVVRTFKA